MQDICDVRHLVVSLSRARLALNVLERLNIFKNCVESCPSIKLFEKRAIKLLLVPERNMKKRIER